MLPHNSTEEDKPVWGLTNNALYSTGTMYNLLKDRRDKQLTQRNFKLVWKVHTLNKTKTFLWLLLYNKLSTNAYLSHIGLSIAPNVIYAKIRKKPPTIFSSDALMSLLFGLNSSTTQFKSTQY